MNLLRLWRRLAVRWCTCTPTRHAIQVQEALDELCAALGQCIGSITCEADLHQTVLDHVAEHRGIPIESEARLSASERPDFVLRVDAQMIAVELKVAGPLAAVTRQVHRYAGLDAVAAVVLVTTRSAHRRLPKQMRGKPLRVVYLNPLVGL